MARVAAFLPDLLFGSKVRAMLEADGHEVELVASPEQAPPVDVLVVDLVGTGVDPASVTAAAKGARTLAFYAHTDVETKQRADAAGFDLVVPRSRMAREGAQLVRRLSAG
jgi:hypothetical protein